MFSDRVWCNNGKDWRHIKKMGKIRHRFFSTHQKTYIATVHLNAKTKTQPIQCYSMFLRHKSWYFDIKKIWDEVESPVTGHIQVEGKCNTHGKPKTPKKLTKANLYDQYISYNVYSNATIVLTQGWLCIQTRKKPPSSGKFWTL